MVQSQNFTLHASAAETSNGNTQNYPVDAAGFVEANFFIEVTAASGTDPTLDIDIQTWDPIGDTWQTLTSFTQATSTTDEMKIVSCNLGRKIAIAWTIGGTDTPSFTFTVSAILKG